MKKNVVLLDTGRDGYTPEQCYDLEWGRETRMKPPFIRSPQNRAEKIARENERDLWWDNPLYDD